VNAKWIEENPIPPEESRRGAFYDLRIEVETHLKEIMDEISSTDEAGLSENERKVRDFYRAGMDLEKLSILKDAPIKGLFAEIDGVEDVVGLSKLLGDLHRKGIDVFWGSSVEQDLKDSNTMAMYIGQSGLSLPDRDYYLADDEKSMEIRAKYSAYTDRMFAASPVLSAYNPVAQVFINIETRLAKASMTRVELRDIERQYNKMTLAELAAISPLINWADYFGAAHVSTPAYAIIAQPEFIKEVNAILKEIPLGDIKAYLRWHTLNGAANFLDETFSQEVFDFYGRTFGGATEMKPRWRRVLGMVNGMLDEAVGQLYVKKHFSEDAKKKINVLVDKLTEAYRLRIEKLDWMSPETKEMALAKLAAVKRKLGYPDKWRDYGVLAMDPDSYFENYLRAHMFEFDRLMGKLGKPVDRTEWYMEPQTVNACYNPLMNEVLFPAAFLQPPFFDPVADDATNFGAVGSTIGHELTHGFDDQGSQFDLNGNLVNWWTPEDKERFDRQTAHLAEQYDAYEVLPGVHVNGKLTLGENIADLGGLLIAYDGLAIALNGDAAKGVDKENAQKFFIGYAITERSNSREETIRTQIKTDPHSPSIYRVNGIVSNMTEFYRAYDAAPGDKLFREESDRVKIW
jgi:putative endopeptidase